MRKSSGLGMKLAIDAIALSIALFIIALFAGYILEDRRSPAADERSVPAPKTY